MANIDKERITLLISEVEKALGILIDYSGMNKEELLGDLKSLGSMKYYFIIAIEACIDICNHIAAKEHLGLPESYADCFKILGDNGIVPKELSNKLINMAKFRNLLVHLYWKVDDEKMYEILQTELGDFEEFVRYISRRYL
ncbi:MAG: DUF86 domain-containing protein [Methanosarcinales archaeon]